MANHDHCAGPGQPVAQPDHWVRRGGIALVVSFGLNLAPDQIGAILAVTAVVLGLITRSRVIPA